MKKFIFVVGAVLYCLLAWAQAHAQQGYTIVYELYYKTTLNPETGDQLIQQNKSVFDQQFYACLSQVQQKAAEASHKHKIYCDNKFPDPEMNAKCHSENEGAKVLMWAQTMREVTRGQAIWSQSTLGQSTISGKSYLELVYPGQYKQIVQQVAPSVRSMMVCQ